MTDFLERYQRGEHEQVWDELNALGEQVGAGSLHDEALAVARETMRRARRNIEMLIPRLVAVGYHFGYGWIQPYARERLVRPYHAAYDPATGKYAHKVLMEPHVPDDFAIGYRVAYEDRLEMAREQPPLFTPANDVEEKLAQLERNIAAGQLAPSNHIQELQRELRAKPSAPALIAELETLMGPLPHSIRAWYELVGGVNFVGDHAQWREFLPEAVPMDEYDYLNPMCELDPLAIYALDERRLAHYRRWMKPDETRFRLTLAEDGTGKYLDAGPRYFRKITLPQPTSDAPFTHGGQYFVAYLRDCFQWGGFPGWARFESRPEEDLAFLTQDLLPL